MTKRGITILYVFFFFFLIIAGGIIYFAFRTDSLIMFRWTDALHLHDFVDEYRNVMSPYLPVEFIRFNLPDGLWSISCLLIMLAIWDSINRDNFLWFCIMPFIAVLSEFLQLCSILPGSFDWMDVLCYSMPLILLLTINTIIKWTKRNYYQLER